MTQALNETDFESFSKFVEGGVTVPPPSTSPLRGGTKAPELLDGVVPPPLRLYKPLSSAAEEYQQWAEHPEHRVYTGVPELDSRMRGTAPGEMTQILGYSHGGKTVVATQILLANVDKNMVLFTPDETSTAVLSKLVALLHDIDAEELERRIFQQDQEARRLLLSTATEYLPNLGVCEENLTLNEMSSYLEEYESVHGECHGVMYDYLRLLKGAGEDFPSKWGNIKAWGRRIKKPLFVLHQTSRSSGAKGRKLGIDSGEYGGEAESTHIIGVRRKRAEIVAEIADIIDKLDSRQTPSEFLERRVQELQYDLTLHEHTITLNLVKNKRPPMKLVDDLDFELNQRTGKISPLRAGEVMRSARAALENRELF